MCLRLSLNDRLKFTDDNIEEILDSADRPFEVAKKNFYLSQVAELSAWLQCFSYNDVCIELLETIHM